MLRSRLMTGLLLLFLGTRGSEPPDGEFALRVDATAVESWKMQLRIAVGAPRDCDAHFFLCASLNGSACQPLMPLLSDSDCMPRAAQLMLQNPYDALQKSLRHPVLRQGIRFSLLRFASRFVRVQSGTDDASRLATATPVFHEGEDRTDDGEVLSPTDGTILVDRLEVDAVISDRLVTYRKHVTATDVKTRTIDDILVTFAVDRIDPDGAGTVDDVRTRDPNQQGGKLGRRVTIGKLQPIPYESHVDGGSMHVCACTLAHLCSLARYSMQDTAQTCEMTHAHQQAAAVESGAVF